ncbi:trichodiene oxygenase [Xylaria sp. FL0064]|nr:trichodiene oxygenase [Xylaria sp. FL0064]
MAQIDAAPAAPLLWPLVLAGGVVLASAVAFYRLLLHPLAVFPGPKLAALTRGYEAYYDIVCNGQYTFKIAEMHKKYGSIVRISPYELHISNPHFYEKIYTREGEWDKYTFTYNEFGAPLSTVCAIDHSVHKRRRAAVNPFFSKASVAAKLSLSAVISALTRDVATEFILGKSYNSLESRDFNAGLAVLFQSSGGVWRITKHLPWYGPLLKSLPVPAWLVQRADDGVKSFFGFLKSMVDMCSKIHSTWKNGKLDPGAPQTVVHAILNSDLPDNEKSFARIFDEASTITGAAFETTANTLRLTLYHIYNNIEVLRRLRAEITATLRDDQNSSSILSRLEQLPYLTAVLMEGLRLSPALATRAMRVSPNRDLSFRGQRIPAGTPVGMTTYLIHRDPDVYSDPDQFKPQRWLDLQERLKLEKFYAPFSKGPRNCLGMHLAWAELYMTVAALVEHFDIVFDSSAIDDITCTSDQFTIGTAGNNGLPVTVRRVKV